MACGRTTLELIEAPGFYDRLVARTRQLAEGLSAAAAHHGRGFVADSVGSMFGLYASPRAPTSFAEVMAADKDAFNRFFHAMLDRGVYLAPSAFEAGFVSIMHDEAVMAEVIAAADDAFAAN